MNINNCNNIDDLINIYKSNKLRFSNNYNNFKNNNFKNKIISICGNDFLNYNNKLGHFFYDYLNPLAKTKKCKMCNFCVMFLNFDKGYSLYCSKNCAIKDADRISFESKILLCNKRKNTMKKLKENPEWFSEYKRKLSVF